jgi:hypothetical protein
VRHRRHQKEEAAKVQAGQCRCTPLRKASRRVSQLYDAILAPCGLRTTQRAILNHISRAGTLPYGHVTSIAHKLDVLGLS